MRRRGVAIGFFFFFLLLGSVRVLLLATYAIRFQSSRPLPALPSNRCGVIVGPKLLQIRTSHTPCCVPATVTDPGDCKTALPPAGQVSIGRISHSSRTLPRGSSNIATPLSRLATMRVSSSMKSTPWGRFKAGEDNSAAAVNAIVVRPPTLKSPHRKPRCGCAQTLRQQDEGCSERN